MNDNNTLSVWTSDRVQDLVLIFEALALQGLVFGSQLLQIFLCDRHWGGEQEINTAPEWEHNNVLELQFEFCVLRSVWLELPPIPMPSKRFVFVKMLRWWNTGKLEHSRMYESTHLLQWFIGWCALSNDRRFFESSSVQFAAHGLQVIQREHNFGNSVKYKRQQTATSILTINACTVGTEQVLPFLEPFNFPSLVVGRVESVRSFCQFNLCGFKGLFRLAQVFVTLWNVNIF